MYNEEGFVLIRSSWHGLIKLQVFNMHQYRRGRNHYDAVMPHGKSYLDLWHGGLNTHKNSENYVLGVLGQSTWARVQKDCIAAVYLCCYSAM